MNCTGITGTFRFIIAISAAPVAYVTDQVVSETEYKSLPYPRNQEILETAAVIPDQEMRKTTAAITDQEKSAKSVDNFQSRCRFRYKEWFCRTPVSQLFSESKPLKFQRPIRKICAFRRQRTDMRLRRKIRDRLSNAAGCRRGSNAARRFFRGGESESES